MNAKRVGCIVQARMGSTRLSGKTLLKIDGTPMLGLVLKRLAKSRLLDEIVVATTELEEDSTIEEFCKREGVKCFRGHDKNVLSRFFYCASKEAFDVVVRITGDCPLTSPVVIDLCIEKFLKGGFDYVSNVHKRTFPRGLDVEVFSYAALFDAFKSSDSKLHREHVTMYIYHNERHFKLGSIENDGSFGSPELRFCVDTKADFEFVSRIVEHFGGVDVGFSEVIDFVEGNPKLKAGNIKEEKLFRKKTTSWHQKFGGEGVKKSKKNQILLRALKK